MTVALLIKLAVTAAVLYVVIVAGTHVLQRRLIYFPDTVRITPESVGLAGVVEREIVAPDGVRVLAWWGPARPGQPTILYFHGNAGAFAVRAERIRKYMARGYGMFMMTYRGFGGSGGTPSERANVADANRAYDELIGLGVQAGDIILYGESLGSGVAVQTAVEKSCAGLILDAPYTSLVDLARQHYPILPARLFMTDRYETDRYIGRVRCPLLVVHGEADDVIPVEMGRAIHAAAGGPKQIVVLSGAGHSDHHLFGSYEAIHAWIGGLREGRLQRAAE